MKKLLRRFILFVFRIRSKRTCRVCGRDARRLNRKLWHRAFSKYVPIVHVSCCKKRFLVVSKSGEI